MGQLNELQRRLLRIPNLTRLAPLDQEKLRLEFPGLPEEYVQFLGAIGFGNLEALQLYSGPVTPEFIYPQAKGDLSNIVLFGDDFQGYCFGFDTLRQFSLVEVDPRGNPRARKEDGFISLIESYLPE